MPQGRIEFESVSAIRYADFYDGRTERARSDIEASTIPDRFWSKTFREGDLEGILDQAKGCRELIEQGEFIRNVRVFELEAEPTWRDITDEVAAQ